MKPDDFNTGIKKAERLLRSAILLVSIATLLMVFLIFNPDLSFLSGPSSDIQSTEDEDKIENGIHIRTGLKEAEGLMTVVNNCTNCHSAKLVIQNRMSKEQWNTTIKWMQETQNLWDLGDNQKIIVNYLTANYPVIEKSRRESLSNIIWYEID